MLTKYTGSLTIRKSFRMMMCLFNYIYSKICTECPLQSRPWEYHMDKDSPCFDETYMFMRETETR